MAKLYSYVVDHDRGFSPNPFGGICTLAKSKYGTIKCKNGVKRNIIELAEVGDWICGTGGIDTVRSAGHGKLIFAMQVDEKIPLAEYCEGMSGNRIDAEHEEDEDRRFALISHHFFYFGRNAINISEIPHRHLNHPFEKKGPAHRCDFSEEFVEDFARWLNANFKRGVHGPPCLPFDDQTLPKCPPQVRRKRCPE